MDERLLEDIVTGIDDKYINETASALYENESRNVTNSDDLVVVEKKIKKFPFALVTAAAVVITVISVVAGVVIVNGQNFSQGETSDSSQSTTESSESRVPDITTESTFTEDKINPYTPIQFPSSPVNNKIYAHYVITENMAITAENTDTWLPYSYVRDPNAPDWYITKNEKNQIILKCGKITLPAALGAATPANIHIGDDSLEDYSLRIKFRFAEGEDLYFSLYETTMRGTIHPDYNVEDKDGTGTPTWFHLSADGKLYKEYTFNNSELILDLGKLDRNEWHTLLIDNIGGSIQLVLDDENKGEIYKATTNEYGSFAFGGYEGVEIMSIKLLDIDNEYLPVCNLSYLPEKLRNELEKAGLGNDINDEHKIGMISAFVTGDASLLPEDTDEDVRRVFEEIYSTIVIKDYYIEERNNSLHFTASYPGKSSIKANEEYVIYEFYQRAENQNDNYFNEASSDVYSLLRLSNDGRLPTDIDIDFINSDITYNSKLTDLIIRDIYSYSGTHESIEDFRTTKQAIIDYAKTYIGIDYIPIGRWADENGKFKIETWNFESGITPFRFLRKNYKDDGTTEEVFVYYQKGDYLNLAEEHIRVYTLRENENGRNTVISVEEYWQTKIESDLALDYLGNTELTLSAEDVIYAYQKYLNEQNWELLNVLWYGNEMKWCGSRGDAQNMFSNMKITSCKNVTDEEYAERFNIGINELIYHITYESHSMGKGSMFIRLKKDGANYYIKETFTG